MDINVLPARLITPEIVCTYQDGERAREAIKILAKGLTPAPRISKPDFLRARNYLIVMMTFANAPRAGGISDITLNHFEIYSYLVVSC